MQPLPGISFSHTTPAPLPSIVIPTQSVRSDRQSIRASPRNQGVNSSRGFNNNNNNNNYIQPQTANFASTSVSARSPRPQTQRSNMNRSSHIFPSTNKGRRINPVLSMSQRICPEIQRVSVHFANLSVTMRNFLTDNSVPTLNPDLPNIYSSLSLAFDTYCHQCTLMFSNVTRSPNQKNFHPASPVFVQGRLLMVKWVQFIEAINSLVDADVGPYRGQIRAYIDEYMAVMKRIAAFAKKTQYYPMPLVTSLRKINRRAERCFQKAVTKLFEPSKQNDQQSLQQNNQNKNQTEDQNQTEGQNQTEDNHREDLNGNTIEDDDGNEDFIASPVSSRNTVRDSFCSLLDTTIGLFEEGGLPKDVMPIREFVRLKARAVNALAMTLEVLSAVDSFHMAISLIKTQIATTNNEINAVHSQLGLPFVVSLTIGSDQKMTTDANQSKSD